MKNSYGPEPYVTLPLEKSKRSLCAQLRMGTLPLSLEVGRFNSIAEEERLCSVCDLRVVEDEAHFMFHCPLYKEHRLNLFEKMQNMNTDLFWCDDNVKLEWLFREDVFSVALFIKRAWSSRIAKLFNR